MVPYSSAMAVAEAPVVPALPVYSPWLLMLAAGVLALMISIAVAFIADYLDPSFRTPRELAQELDLPLLATFAKNGHPPRFGLIGSGKTGAERAMAGSGGGEKLLPVEDGGA